MQTSQTPYLAISSPLLFRIAFASTNCFVVVVSSFQLLNSLV